MKNLTEEKLLDLLCKKAVSGLDATESEQLKELEKAFPEWKDDDSFEFAAAAINLSAIDASEEMPAHLRSKILASADEFYESIEETQETISFAPRGSQTSGSLSSVSSFDSAPKPSFWQSLGWGIAAFACVALAVNLYLTRFQTQPDVAQKPDVVQTPTPQLTDAQKREQLLASVKDTVKLELAKADPKAAAEIQGDVVWSNSEQKGFLRLRGLPVNDPNKETYQIWIFDGEQDEKYPIDGGVFDVNQAGEVIIPMDAKLQVKAPKMIAITKEKPGGVVVSDRTGIIAIAKV
jgi:anti-sigma-K factor RskA